MLLTERLRLVPCAEGDVEALHALLTHPEVRRYLMDDKLVERTWVFDVIASSRRTFAEARYGLWRVESLADGALIGLAGLRVTAGAREPQLLYALDPAYWGRGLATEAAQVAFDDLRTRVGLRRIVSIAQRDNEPSIRIMKALGFTFERAMDYHGFPCVLHAWVGAVQ